MKKSFMLASSIIMIAASSFAIATQSESDKYHQYHISDQVIPLSETELDETTGKMGPVITGLIGGVNGAASSITADVVADRPINWTDAGISAGAGFVGGMTGNILLGNSAKGALAGIALSSSATGALNSLKSGMVVGNNCQSSCH
ncbi:TPA: hypothetical protein SCR39_004750 [Escherichia coli O157]|nr:hypothetical protein [Escherichia coli]MEC9598772.1 hypothetical protein [Escherichia coli]HEG1721934.1 hypothetical protein [Escherichia coli O157]